MESHRLNHLAIITIIVCIFVTIGGVLIDVRYIPYVSASAGIGSLLYLLSQFGDEWRYVVSSKTHRKTHDISIFAGVFMLSLLSRKPFGVPDEFYWVLVSVFLLLLVRILLAPSKISIIQVLLFAIVLRATLWQSAPVIRHDPRLHVGISRFILENGESLSSPQYYYRDFPVAHVLSAAVTMITDLGIKEAYFVSIGIPAVFGVIAVFAITRRLVASRDDHLRPALLAAAFLAIAAAHVAFTAYPITQTLTLITHATSLFLVTVSKNNRMKLVVFGYIGVLSVTHNSAVISLTLIFGALFLFSILFSKSKKYRSENTVSPRHIAGSTLIVLIGGIASIEYLHQVDYFQTQVRRVLSVFIFSTQNAASDISGAAGGNAYTLADPILHIGIGLFVTTIGLTLALFMGVRHIQSGMYPNLSYIWTPAALALFALVGIGIVLAGIGRITRIRPEVLLVVAPVIGASFHKLANRKIGVAAVCLILLATPMLAVVAAEQSYRNPLTPPTNRAQDDYTNHMSSAEVAALEFTEENADSLTSGRYVHGTSEFRDVPDGSIEIESRLPRNNITSSDLKDCSSTVLYRTSYQFYPDVDRPPKMDGVYDSGKASLIQCSA